MLNSSEFFRRQDVIFIFIRIAIAIYQLLLLRRYTFFFKYLFLFFGKMQKLLFTRIQAFDLKRSLNSPIGWKPQTTTANIASTPRSATNQFQPQLQTATADRNSTNRMDLSHSHSLSLSDSSISAKTSCAHCFYLKKDYVVWKTTNNKGWTEIFICSSITNHDVWFEEL